MLQNLWFEFFEGLSNLPRSAKKTIVIVSDIFICLVTVAIAYWLRLSDWTMPFGNRWLSFPVAAGLAIPIYWWFDQYRQIFRYASWASYVRLFQATMIYGLIYAAIYTIVVVPDVPRTIGVIQPILLLFFVGSARAFIRPIFDGPGRLRTRVAQRRAIIFGTGAAGRQLEAALERTHDMKVMAFVDDDQSMHGGNLHGKKIYPPDQIKRLIELYDATDFLLAIPSASRKRRSEIIASVAPLPIKIRSVPGVFDIASGRVEVNELREPEIEDLLGREVANPDRELLRRHIVGKCVLVTGAGGSIGSELCRQIVQQKPDKLILYEMAEFNLYAIHRELEQLCGDTVEIVPALGTVQSEKRLRLIMERWRPHTVYHAAAYKHVPLVEDNVSEAVLNNAIGTFRAMSVAQATGVEKFVLISTDKAVRPTNVMGATKRLAEQILQAAADRESGTAFTMVRFGNVLGSSGSVVPLFRSQIKAGGPVTITHPDITRYFMTIPEASQLVIQAGSMGSGGEVFVLDMGEPVKIADLAARMIELSGLQVRSTDNPDGDIEIETVGLRPGEKLYEELLIGNNPIATTHPLIMKAREDFLAWDDLVDVLGKLEGLALAGEDAKIRVLLQRVIPEFQPNDGVGPAADWQPDPTASGRPDPLRQAV